MADLLFCPSCGLQSISPRKKVECFLPNLRAIITAQKIINFHGIISYPAHCSCPLLVLEASFGS